MMARDLKKKLLLLGLNVEKYFFAGIDDEKNEVKHYERIREIANPTECRFWLFNEPEESHVIAKTMSVIKECIGKIISFFDQKQVIQFAYNEINFASYPTAKLNSNIVGNIAYSIDNKFSRTWGKITPEALKICIYGGSQIADIFVHNAISMTESLNNILNEYNISNYIKNRAQLAKTSGDSFAQFLIDNECGKFDLLLLTVGFTHRFKDGSYKNHLSIRKTDAGGTLEAVFAGEYFQQLFGIPNYGVNFETDYLDILIGQLRAINAIGRIYGFRCWAIIFPQLDILPESQSRDISTRSARHRAQIRNLKDEFVSKCTEYCKVLDLSAAFINYDNIFPFFMDEVHITEAGNEIISKQIANEIIKEYPDLIGSEI
jgi:hypothetical protein